MAYTVWRERVNYRFRPAVTSDVKRAHARGAQVRTLGRMCAVRLTFYHYCVSGVIAVGRGQRNLRPFVDHHRVHVPVTHGPTEFDAVWREFHVRYLVGKHV